MNNPIVTVVVPIYNVEKYLKRCVDSIIHQSYQNLEIILVDDGSLDNCPQICDDYARIDSRINVIHKNNAGLGMARNTGIEYATGKYICFFDSDDYIERDTIEICVKNIIEHDADLVIFGHDCVTNEGSLIRVQVPCTPKKIFCDDEIKNVLLPMSLYANIANGEDWKTPLSAWNKLYSMDIIRSSGWKFVSERNIISEDYYSLTELHEKINRVVVIDRVFYHYVVNHASLSRSFNPDRFEHIKFFYQAMILLSIKMNLCETLDQPIKLVTFGCIIGAMKQIVNTKRRFRQRYQELKKVIQDEFLRELIMGTDYSKTGLQKKVFYAVTKYKLTGLCFILLYLKK